MFSPIIKLDSNTIYVIFLNPFKKKVIVHLADINKIVITAGRKNSLIAIDASDFTRKIYLNMLILDLKNIFKHLKLTGVNVQSDGHLVM